MEHFTKLGVEVLDRENEFEFVLPRPQCAKKKHGVLNVNIYKNTKAIKDEVTRYHQVQDVLTHVLDSNSKQYHQYTQYHMRAAAKAVNDALHQDANASDQVLWQRLVEQCGWICWPSSELYCMPGINAKNGAMDTTVFDEVQVVMARLRKDSDALNRKKQTLLLKQAKREAKQEQAALRKKTTTTSSIVETTKNQQAEPEEEQKEEQQEEQTQQTHYPGQTSQFRQFRRGVQSLEQ